MAMIPALNFTGIGMTLLLMSVAIGIIGASIVGIMVSLTALTAIMGGDGGQAINALIIACGVITYVTALMAGILIVLSEFPIAVISGVAASVVAITVCIGAMTLMVAGLALLTKAVGPGALWNAVGAIFVLSIIVTGIYALLVAINRASGVVGSIGALLMLGGIVAAVAGMASIIAALALIPAQQFDQAMAALEAISLCLALLIGVTATLVGVSAAALPALAPALLSVAAGFVAFALAGALFAASIWLIVDAVRNGWAFIQDFSVNGSQVMDDFASQLYNSTESIGRVLVVSIPEIMNYVLAGIVRALETIATYVPIIGFRLTQILLEIFANACLALAGSAAVLIRGLVWIVEAIDQEIEPLVAAVLDLVIHVVNAVGTWLAENSEETADAIMMFIIGILLVIGQTVRKLHGFFYSIAKPGIDFLVGWWNYLIDFWAETWQKRENELKTMALNIALIPQLIAALIKVAFEKVKEFAMKIWLKIYTLQQKLSDFKDKLIEGVKTLPTQFVEAGKNIVDGILTGIKSKLNLADSKIVDFAQALINAFSGPKGINSHSPSKVFEQLGEYMVDGLDLGINNSMSGSLSNMEDYASGLTGTFGDTMSTGLGALFANNNLLNGSLDLSAEGSMIGEGLGTGIQNGFASMIGGTGLATMATLTPVVNGNNLSMDNILDQYLGSGYGQFNLNGNVTGIDGLNQFSANIQNSIDDSKIMQEIKNEINMLRGEVNMFNQGVAGHAKGIMDAMNFDVYISPDKLVGATVNEMTDAVALEVAKQSRSGG
jgi:hypothetical protein